MQVTLISCCMHMEQITLILILLINLYANVKPRLCNSMPLGAAWAYYIKVLILASTAS